MPSAACLTSAGDLAHGDVGVGDDRRQREQRQRQQGGEPGPAVGPELLHAGEVGGHEQGQQRERRDRPADVRDVDGEEAALAEVAQPERDRQPDHQRQQQRGDREQQLLLHQVQHAAVAGPVGPRREVVPGVAEDGHAFPSLPLPRVQGVSSRCASTMRTSRRTASTTQSTDAVNSSARKLVDHAVLDQVAQAAVGHQRPDGGERDGRDGRHPQPGHDHGGGQRQLDPDQQPGGAVAQAPGGLHDLVGHRPEPLEHRAHQDRQRVERQRDHHGRLRQAGERDHQRQQRQRRDRVDPRGDADHRRLQPRRSGGRPGPAGRR